VIDFLLVLDDDTHFPIFALLEVIVLPGLRFVDGRFAKLHKIYENQPVNRKCINWHTAGGTL
jgi:hypothetical protein